MVAGWVVVGLTFYSPSKISKEVALLETNVLKLMAVSLITIFLSCLAAVTTIAQTVPPSGTAVENARAEARQEEDLAAQKSMANSAYWTVMLTIPSLLISAAAILIAGNSLRLTREAMKDARDVGEAQVRSYLSLPPKIAIGMGDEWKEDDPSTVWWNLYIEISIHNSGNSSALDVHTKCKAQMFTKMEGQEEVSIPLEIIDNQALPPWIIIHAQSNGGHVFRSILPFKHPRELSMFSGFRFSVDIKSSYRTVFEKKEHIECSYVSEKFHLGAYDGPMPRFELAAASKPSGA